MRRLSVERHGAALEVQLDRPPHNRIDERTLDELDEVMDRVDDDPEVKALLIHSGPHPFGTGVDLEAVAASLAAGVDPEAFVERAHEVLGRLDGLGVLTVGVLKGLCLGGALELALCLDVRVAEAGCRVGLPELRLGLLPGFGGLARLRRTCGAGMARELLMSGRTLGVRRAYDRGLVDHRVPGGEGMSAARALTRTSGSLDRDVLAAAKSVLVPSLETELARERDVLLARLRDPRTALLIQQTLDRSDPWKHLPSTC